MLTIGTRGSLLATTQSGHIRDALHQLGYHADLRIVATQGDVNMAPVERIGVGVFTQALRDALAQGDCDIAVHSFKDLPTAPDPRFYCVVPQRADVRDCLIARDGLDFAALPEGAVIGTGAPRRISQLRAMRPDIQTRPLRGNIDTRIAKVRSGELDGVVLAYAGLARVNRNNEATDIFNPEQFIPAPAQGALAVECRADDQAAIAAISQLADHPATACALAERAVLAHLEAGCTAPVAAYARLEADTLTLVGSVTRLDGGLTLRAHATGAVDQAANLGEEVAAKLFARGAALLLD
ncbi:hydroxymethylbilane synthase [Corynebacterium sp. ES2730-CONJ]|uniref:hydroxymethylbilane synthase n=1 Tax=Corynebacterium sp. ES2730-CONJ TaxID=2973941 RepID=UPI00216B2F3D|nr:hydroxymethylbilane synthase [Corynebacterium sp. ES2730-CONJ]MCS4531632.1 hydroxymethylbilane synthase [Corynebacterium sp. ES2730-CONJ]